MLKNEQRDLDIYGRFCNGASYKKLSFDFDISESGIKQALFRIRKKLGVEKKKGVREWQPKDILADA